MMPEEEERGRTSSGGVGVVSWRTPRHDPLRHRVDEENDGRRLGELRVTILRGTILMK